MKVKNEILKMFCSFCLLCVIAFGLMAIIGSGGGSGADGSMLLLAHSAQETRGGTHGTQNG